jgi:DNA-binding winged helix-turn-helix (wHTH) protein
MLYDICILAPAGALARLLLLECEGMGKATAHVTTPAPLPEASLYIIDADAFDHLPAAGNVLLVGRTLSDTHVADGARTITKYRRPFALDRLRTLVRAGGEVPTALSLSPDGSSVRIGTRVIPLTPTEYACLSCLYEANGAPVCREKLYAAVWGDGPCRPELVNLYLHYLRKKLETDGHRYLYARRGAGYILKREDTL